MHQVENNTQQNSGGGGGQQNSSKNNNDYYCCASKSSKNISRDMRPNPSYEIYYKIGSRIPSFILASIFLYIYYNIVANYIGPLILGSYKLDNFNAEGLQRLFIQNNNDNNGIQNYDLSQSILIKMLSLQEQFYRMFIQQNNNNNSNNYTDQQVKGIVMFIILHLLLFLLVWALIKTSITPAGNVKTSKKWEEEIRQFQDNLREQEYGFLQMFEQKYSMTYMKNQRNSKTIPVHERDLENYKNQIGEQQGGIIDQEFNMVFSEKNDSDNEGQNIPDDNNNNTKQQQKQQKQQQQQQQQRMIQRNENELKEIRETTEEDNILKTSQMQEYAINDDIEDDVVDNDQDDSDNKDKNNNKDQIISSNQNQQGQLIGQGNRKIDMESIHSESEVVYEERNEEIEFLKSEQIGLDREQYNQNNSQPFNMSNQNLLMNQINNANNNNGNNGGNGEHPFAQYMGIYDQEEYDRFLNQLYKMHIEQEIDKKNYRPCKKCYQTIKPIRTHHCSQCKECILKMDHHCQWVDNCIGFYNYKYFINMLTYATFSLFFCSITYLQCYLDACVTEQLTDWAMFKIALSFFFIITMNFFLFCFTIFHFWLIFQNKTTIEFCEKKSDSSKYDLGCYQNVKSIFGNNMLTWCIPIDPKIEGDGAYFKQKCDI